MRQAIGDVSSQAWRLRRTIALILAPALGVLVLVVAAAGFADVELVRVLRDPLALVEANPLTGFLSNLGIVMWSAASGACFVATFVLRRERASREAIRFFFWSGAFTILLALDDLYQLHEAVIPALLGRGQSAILAGYLMLAIAYAWRFRGILIATEYVLLVLAGSFFALSYAVDVLHLAGFILPESVLPDDESPLYEAIEHLVEDGAKFVGISFWLAYFLRTAADALEPHRGRDTHGDTTAA
jgi:hypothetical protein